MTNIRFERKIDESSHDEWYFYYLHEAWVLQEYTLYKRLTKKHKPRRVCFYNRLDNRDNTIEKKDIEITHEIEMMLLGEIVKAFRIMK